MSPLVDNQTRRRRPENAAWFVALILILVASLVVWAVFSLRVDVFTEALKTEEPVAVLIVVDDGNRPLMTEIFLYHPLSRKGALIAIPDETGSLLEPIDRVDRLSALYDPKNPEVYKSVLSNLVGLPIDFMLWMNDDNFEKVVDHLGGVDIFIPNAVDENIDSVRYLFPPGGVRLDGAKVRLFLNYKPVGELTGDRSEREHRITQAFLKSLGLRSELILSDEVYPYFWELLSTNLDRQGMATFIRELASLDTEQLVYQGVLGNKRLLDGKEVLFPYYDGKLLRETVGRIGETLARSDAFGDQSLTVNVEILNGTSVNGMASRTAQIYRNYGFRISSVKNAERDDYERTVVLDRRGNTEAARRVAELIRCEQIHSSVDDNRDETVDVTIILGKDFDGRYVKK